MFPMQGHLDIGGHRIANAGFMHPALPVQGVQQVGPSVPIFSRGSDISDRTEELIERMQRLGDVERVDITGDVGQILSTLGQSMGEFKRAITSTMTAFPVRENLEAPARILVPLQTPLRNKLPRTVGNGTASAWRQITSLGGGFGFTTTVTSGAASATQTVASTAGMLPGHVLQFVTATDGIPIGGSVALSLRTVSSVTNATTVVLTATITTVTGDLVYNTSRPAGAGTPAGLTAVTHSVRSFYEETKSPAEKTTVYAAKSAAYKLLGSLGSVTGRKALSGCIGGPLSVN